MKWWPFKKTEPAGVPVEHRSAYDSVPQKVYVGKDGDHYEYYLDPGRLHDLLHGYYSDSNFLNLFYCVPEVWAPVHEIASRVASATWQLRKSWNDEIDYNDRQFNRLFSQPNPMRTMYDFVYQSVCYEICTGKQFEFANVPSSLPFEFNSVVTRWNLPAHEVCIQTKKNFDIYSSTSLADFIERYTVPQNGKNREFPVDRVLPRINIDLRCGDDIKKPASLLLGADKAIKNLIPVYEARGVIYIKRGALGFIVSRKSDESGLVALTKTEKEQLIQDYQSTYGVTGNKSPVAITNQPVDFIRTSMSIQELQPFDETLADAAALYACLRVPAHLIPSKDKSTYANASADMKSFYSDVIIPWGKKYAEAWTAFYRMEENRRYICADYSHVDVLQENRMEKAKVDQINGGTYLQAFQNGVCTLNDWIVSRGDKKVSGNPIFDKKTVEMSPEELEIIKNAFNLKTNTNAVAPENSGSQTEGPNA